MIVRYHELNAMMGVGRPGRHVTLNDLHKSAWAIYTATGKMEIPKGTQRPFTFRADALSGQPGRYLFVIRSAFEFANSKAREIDLSEGNSLRLEMASSPYKRVANAEGKTRRVVPPEDEWIEVTEKRFRSAGLAAKKITLDILPSLPMRHGQARQRLLMVEADVTVTDPIKAADAWLRGAEVMRAYGMGQLMALPDSLTQAVAA